MSLVPMLFSNWWENLERPHYLMDQHFGVGLHPDHLAAPLTPEHYMHLGPGRERRLAFPSYYRPWGDLQAKTERGFSAVKADKDKFQVVLDIQQFKPDEIAVKVVDNCVVVSAEHDEKQDEHGWISRQFVRKYLVPEQCNAEEVSSSLSSDGVLTITAPRKEVHEAKNERMVKIEHTGKPAIREKTFRDEQDEKKEKKAEKKAAEKK